MAAAAAHIDGGALSLVWSLPFAGLLLSIALLPLLAPHFWEHHFGKVAAFWALLFLLPCAVAFGVMTASTEFLHALLLDYFPFINLLFALFVIAGGIRVSGNLVGTPATNTAILAFGTLSANLFGTTGASMLLIRPLIQANRHRQHKVQTFVFFIFLVCNIGGSLTPLGPPLFLGYLKGVDFLWPLEAMLRPMLFTSGVLLALFYVIDRLAWNREWAEVRGKSRIPRQLRIEGLHNVIYLAAVAGTVLVSGVWQRDTTIPIGLGIEMPVNGLVRDSVLLAMSFLSWKTTPRPIRVENAFTWAPMQEVAMLFAAIFITMIPMLAMLRAGSEGPFVPLLSLVSTPDGHPVDAAYFWLTGGLSSFLDNAPTYLVFFNLAGGDAQHLMGPLASTLLAISAGAVFMGANTYIGNAPNFMVRSICEERGIKMPSFIGYMLWSGAILLPLFAVVTWIWFL
ncbi:MAG: sodium:proton antiporter [Methyloceanibacter sp.]|nr:sodium:proton antiporter [Methyloceanibacter sp.]